MCTQACIELPLDQVCDETCDWGGLSKLLAWELIASGNVQVKVVGMLVENKAKTCKEANKKEQHFMADQFE